MRRVLRARRGAPSCEMLHRALRIVSLCPSTTETLVDFGLAGQLVGITRFCIHPADVVRDIRKVGGTKNPDLARIRALRPDLVLFNEEENRKEDYERLRGDLRVDATIVRRVQDVPEQLLHLGRLTGAEIRAQARAQQVEAARARLAETRAKVGGFRYAYLIWRRPYMAVGGDTYVSDLFAEAGGENVFEGARDRYPAIDVAALRAERPDVVFLSDEPFPFKAKHAAELQAEAPELRTELIRGDDCCWHGVRTLRGLALMQSLSESIV